MHPILYELLYYTTGFFRPNNPRDDHASIAAPGLLMATPRLTGGYDLNSACVLVPKDQAVGLDPEGEMIEPAVIVPNISLPDPGMDPTTELDPLNIESLVHTCMIDDVNAQADVESEAPGVAQTTTEEGPSLLVAVNLTTGQVITPALGSNHPIAHVNLDKLGGFTDESRRYLRSHFSNLLGLDEILSADPIPYRLRYHDRTITAESTIYIGGRYGCNLYITFKEANGVEVPGVSIRFDGLYYPFFNKRERNAIDFLYELERTLQLRLDPLRVGEQNYHLNEIRRMRLPVPTATISGRILNPAGKFTHDSFSQAHEAVTSVAEKLARMYLHGGDAALHGVPPSGPIR